jgi:hypothetical protein
MIFFKNGEVVHAMCDNESGERAFFTILRFQGGTLQNIRGVEPPTVSITKSLESLLFEVALKSDEEEEKGEVASVLEDLDNAILESVTPVSDKNPTASPGKTGKTTIESTSTEDTDMTNIQKILAEFTNIEGVHTACLVGRDGFLLDSLARAGIDAEMIGAIASSGFGSAESMGNQLGQGNLNMTMLEYNDGPVLFAPVGDEAFLVIVADKDTNLGWIRIAIKKNSKRIQEVAAL